MKMQNVTALLKTAWTSNNAPAWSPSRNACENLPFQIDKCCSILGGQN
jgi:hypothetical protein